MNPASLKANLKWVKRSGTIIVDTNAFIEKGFEKAGYDGNPLDDDTLQGYNVVRAPISDLTVKAVSKLELEHKVALKSKKYVCFGYGTLFV